MSVMSLVQGSFVPADEDLADDSPDYGDDDLLEIRKRLISCCPTLTDESLESKSYAVFCNEIQRLIVFYTSVRLL